MKIKIGAYFEFDGSIYRVCGQTKPGDSWLCVLVESDTHTLKEFSGNDILKGMSKSLTLAKNKELWESEKQKFSNFCCQELTKFKTERQ